MTSVQILIAIVLLQQGFFGLLWLGAAWLRLARRPALHWGATTLLLAIGMALLVERDTLGEWAGRLLPYVLNVLAFAIARRGVQVFARLRVTDGEHYGVVLLTLGVVSLSAAGVLDPMVVRVVGSSAMAWSLMRGGAEVVRGLYREFGVLAAWTCSTPLWIIAALLALRAASPLWSGHPAGLALTVDTGVNVALMFAFIALGLMLNASLCAMVVLRLVRRLQHLSRHDALTGVLNRRGLEQALALEHGRLRRHGRPFALLAVDVDNFKRINDTHGHAAGDAVLVGLATTLRVGCREIDRVGRTGGEEFCVVLPEADRGAAELAAARLLAAVRDHAFVIPDGTLRVTVSLGVVVAEDRDEPIDLLWRRVDRALYAAKAGGRDRAAVVTTNASAPLPLLA